MGTASVERGEGDASLIIVISPHLSLSLSLAGPVLPLPTAAALDAFLK